MIEGQWDFLVNVVFLFGAALAGLLYEKNRCVRLCHDEAERLIKAAAFHREAGRDLGAHKSVFEAKMALKLAARIAGLKEPQ